MPHENAEVLSVVIVPDCALTHLFSALNMLPVAGEHSRLHCNIDLSYDGAQSPYTYQKH